MMTEGDLHKLPSSGLIDLMIKSTQELIDFTSIKNEIEHVAKKEELKLIQKIIAERRAGFYPLVPISV